MQLSEMRFSQKIKGITMFDKFRNTAIRESLNIESLLVWIERSQLRWFGYVSRMPLERLLKRTFDAEVNQEKTLGRPRTKWCHYMCGVFAIPCVLRWPVCRKLLETLKKRKKKDRLQYNV